MNECQSQQPLMISALDGGKRVRSMIALHADAGIKSTKMALVIEYLHTHQLLLRAFTNQHHSIRGNKIKLSTCVLLLLDYLKNKAINLFEQINPSERLRAVFTQVCTIDMNSIPISLNNYQCERKQRYNALKIADITTAQLFKLAFASYAQFINPVQLQIYEQIGHSFGICYHVISVLKINNTSSSIKLWQGTIVECFTRNQLVDLFASQLNTYKQLCTQCCVYNGLFEILSLYLTNQFKQYLAKDQT